MTASMMGPPDYPDHPVPDWETFCTDYVPCYFDDSEPLSGRCFIIVAEGQDVGVVCHNVIDQRRRLTELDIWLRSEADCGKGYGSNALRLCCDHLHESYGVEEFILRPSKRNRRAISAYRRAGFELLPLTPAEQHVAYGDGDYADSAVLSKRIG